MLSSPEWIELVKHISREVPEPGRCSSGTFKKGLVISPSEPQGTKKVRAVERDARLCVAIDNLRVRVPKAAAIGRLNDGSPWRQAEEFVR